MKISTVEHTLTHYTEKQYDNYFIDLPHFSVFDRAIPIFYG